MTADSPWTIGRLLQWTTSHFKQHSPTPRLDAEVLLAACRGCQRIELYTAYDEVASDAIRQQFRDLVRRRSAGEPVAYLVGHREFYSLSFEVTRDVLIPRPETELVVMSVLDAAKMHNHGQRPLRIMDVGTGSGVIAISVARHLPGCELTALDISSAALDVARRNARALQVDDRIHFLQSDLLQTLPSQAAFDLIASNPPYVSESELDQLDDEVKNFEPRLALVAGPTGTEVIARLIPQAAERLFPGGQLFVEISPMIQTAVRDLFTADPQFDEPSVIKDLAGLPRVVTAQRKSEQ